MPVTAWRFDLNGEEYGAGGEDGIIPAALAEVVSQREGQKFVTLYDKPFTLKADDAQSVYDYFDTTIDPHGYRVPVRWEYAPDEGAIGDAVP
jgi:hypothetical protein